VFRQPWPLAIALFGQIVLLVYVWLVRRKDRA